MIRGQGVHLETLTGRSLLRNRQTQALKQRNIEVGFKELHRTFIEKSKGAPVVP